MVAADAAKHGPAIEPIGDCPDSGIEVVLGEAGALALAEALDRSQLDLARSALGTGRDRSHERRLAGRAPAPGLPPERDRCCPS